MPSEKTYRWYSITGTKAILDEKLLVNNIAELLEENFNNIGVVWWRIGKELGNTKGGKFAHVPTAASYNSDFGQMLAWAKVTEMLAAREDIFLAVCDDPWVFRHLAQINRVTASQPPKLWIKATYLLARGYLARTRLAIRNSIAVLLFRKYKNNVGKAKVAIIAYAHPSSKSEGFDAYFGNLLDNIPSISRLIHTDGNLGFGQKLMGKGTASLHGWGSVLYCIPLIFRRWRPDYSKINAEHFWLVRRSVAIENGGAGIATNLWQTHCQKNFMLELMPKVILWPWENHPWERELTRCAKEQNIRTVGYQHAVIGVQQFNPCPDSNTDGLKSIPSKIICSGLAYYKQLLKWGVPEERLVIGGAFRFTKADSKKYDPRGPVFVAASADTEITNSLMKAVLSAQGGGRKFLVKIHPLYPKKIVETESIKVTDKTIPEQDGISAVVYGTGASGLEGLLAGIPTFRIRPHNKVAVNVLPEGLDAVPFFETSLREKLDTAVPPKKLSWDKIYAPVTLNIWRKQLLIE